MERGLTLPTKWAEKPVPFLQAGAKIDLVPFPRPKTQARAGFSFGIRALIDSVKSVNIGLGRG